MNLSARAFLYEFYLVAFLTQELLVFPVIDHEGNPEATSGR
jgi:hypothetical protein